MKWKIEERDNKFNAFVKKLKPTWFGFGTPKYPKHWTMLNTKDTLGRVSYDFESYEDANFSIHEEARKDKRKSSVVPKNTWVGKL